MTDKIDYPLCCIVCGVKPESAFGDKPAKENQPYGATAFTSHGHYGSTFFDSMGASFIEINICDECLRWASDHGQIIRGEYPPRPPKVKYVLHKRVISE